MAVRRLPAEFSTATVMTWSGLVSCPVLAPIAALSGDFYCRLGVRLAFFGRAGTDIPCWWSKYDHLRLGPFTGGLWLGGDLDKSRLWPL
ncbi:MAG: hypothetical protein CMM74_15895 [Rhodospirillaceae bacterium]|nr:hypothetical protein [Rhodospirillaceae bacterium]